MTELTITPLCDIFDLLLGIGLIALGVCGWIVIITIEIYYFRRGGKKHGKTCAEHQRGGRSRGHI